jgi:KDO2-lipid IV(A) lauroyltransferase
MLIGHLAYDLCEGKRDVMRENLAVVTGKRGPELDSIVRQGFVHFIQMIADNVRFLHGDFSEVAEIMGEWSGLEHLLASQARGKGTVLITGHLGAWELGGILLAVRNIPVTVVTLAEPLADLGEWREQYRKKFGISTITLGEDRFAFLQIVQTLRNNGVVALLVDRPYGEHSLPVEMFHRTALFSPAASLLWQHTGATILPAFVFAQPNGKYASHAYPPIEMSTAADPTQSHHVNTQRIAHFFASLLQTYPDQWYNFVPVWTDFRDRAATGQRGDAGLGGENLRAA